MTARRNLEWSQGSAGPVLAAEDGWRAYAACKDTDPDLFFPDPGVDHRAQDAEAKRICAGCFVHDDCLAFVHANPDDTKYGIWAGLTEFDRRPAPGPPQPVGVSEKACYTCRTTKLASEFHRDSRGTGGLASSCKGCRQIVRKQRTAAA